MLTKVEAYSPRLAAAIILQFGSNPSTDPIQVHNIDGLEPVKASVNTTPYGSFDGETYNGSSVGNRNIVLTLGLNPNWVDQSIGSLRQLLYKYFMPKLEVNLRFFSDLLPTCEINGYVESIEPNIFSKDPQVQVSIICPEPDFVAIAPTIVTGIVSNGPFKAPDLNNYTVINYVGTSPTGFKLEINNSPTVEEYLEGPITINNLIDRANLDYVETIAFDATIDNVTIIEFNSIVGQKYIHRIFTGDNTATSILKTVYDDEVWPTLILGDNRISVNAGNDAGGISGAGLEWSLEYHDRFGGL